MQARTPRPTHKLNIDAKVAGSSGVGGVAAMSRGPGRFIFGSLRLFRGISDSTMLEALAVREAMSLTKDLNLHDIHVVSDCKVVIDDIVQGVRAGYGAIIHKIIEYSRILICNFVNEFRGSNSRLTI